MPVYTCSADHRKSRGSDPKSLDVVLVNNMPDPALEATQRQFGSLLEAGSAGLSVRLRFCALRTVPRSEVGRNHVASYRVPEDMWDTGCDGLIVTGAEPLASDLCAEPYWQELTELIDWAERETSSSIWSCLAAHAAVLHNDGIHRNRLDGKRFGVFEYERVGTDPLVSGAPSCVHLPHSRWNDLSEAELVSSGYQILTRSETVGVDAFIKRRNSLFVFFQGHPEYDPDTLLREYRRDIKRFVRRERDTYPSMPRNYFDEIATAEWRAVERRARADRREGVCVFPDAATSAENDSPWRAEAVRMYRNWLSYLSERKGRRLRRNRSAVSVRN